MNELTQIEQLYNKIPKKVIAKFTTRLQQYQIDAQEIDIPTQMDEDQLNKLLRQFLQGKINYQTLDNLHFEFLVGSNILRGQLKSHIIRYQISCEQTLIIEYFLAFEPLQSQIILPEQDWISILQLIQHPSGNHFASGFFNGSMKIYSNSNKQVLKASIDENVIKSMKIFTSEIENSYYLVAGGLSQQICIGSLSLKNQHKIQFQQLSLTQHKGSIEAIDINPLIDGHFCTANNQGQLFIYKIPENFLSSDEDFNQVKKKKKKAHLNEKSITFVASQTIHQDSIHALCWINQDRIISGSSDHSIRMIDVQKMKQIGKVLTKDSITTSIDYFNQKLLTSHQDGYIRLWDVRTPQFPTNTFKGHSKLVSSVKFNSKPHIFASGSYDTTVKIWDCRSSFPLQNIGTHHDKVFSIIWKQQQQIVAGGADSQISIHKI